MRRTPEVTLGAGAPAIHGPDDGTQMRMATPPAGNLTADELQQFIASVAQGQRGTCVRVRLGYPYAQVRELDRLPPVPSRLLESLVQEHSARFFRVSREPVVVAARWLPRPRGEPPRAIALAGREALLEAICDAGRAAGFSEVVISGADRRTESLRLVPPRERSRRAGRRRRMTSLLAGVAAASWLGVASIVYLRADAVRRASTAELAALQVELAGIRAVRAHVDSLEHIASVLGPSAATPSSALSWLARVATALPDNAFLTSAAWQPGEAGYVSGVAPRAAAVLAAIDRSGAVPSPRLEGAAVRDARAPGSERFTLRFGAEERQP